MTLDDMQRLCDDATPGPWIFCHGDLHNHWELWNPKTAEWVVQDDSGVEPSTENLTFIAHSRTLLPKLIEVARLAKEQHGSVCDSRDYERMKQALKALETE